MVCGWCAAGAAAVLWSPHVLDSWIWLSGLWPPPCLQQCACSATDSAITCYSPNLTDVQVQGSPVQQCGHVPPHGAGALCRHGGSAVRCAAAVLRSAVLRPAVPLFQRLLGRQGHRAQHFRAKHEAMLMMLRPVLYGNLIHSRWPTYLFTLPWLCVRSSLRTRTTPHSTTGTPARRQAVVCHAA